MMTPENSIFRTDVPTITHWHKELVYSDTCAMLHREYNEMYEKYQLSRPQEEPKSNEGMGLILSGLFYRICAVFPYAIIGYCPHDINIRILWKLYEYADPKVKDFTYLIKKTAL